MGYKVVSQENKQKSLFPVSTIRTKGFYRGDYVGKTLREGFINA